MPHQFKGPVLKVHCHLLVRIHFVNVFMPLNITSFFHLLWCHGELTTVWADPHPGLLRILGSKCTCIISESHHITRDLCLKAHKSRQSGFLLFHGLKCCCRASFCFCWNLWALAFGCNERPEFGVENYIFNKTIYMHFISRAKLSSALATRSLQVLPTALGEFMSNEFWTPQPVGPSTTAILKRLKRGFWTLLSVEKMLL